VQVHVLIITLKSQALIILVDKGDYNWHLTQDTPAVIHQAAFPCSVLLILLCPIYNANYNESLMILNGKNDSQCTGTADLSANPPVLKFRLSIHQNSLEACNNIDNEVGTGAFSQFSNIQHVNISGKVESSDPATGMITYRPLITYMYSCMYPLQYVLNNTEMAVSLSFRAGVNLAINDNNGSFISTLNMSLFTNSSYNTPLIIPATGVNLKEQIWVEVRATNLSNRFNVLLDQCFATVDVYDNATNGYNLFVGCPRDPQTKVIENGESQTARFVFEAFRFVEHKNLKVSRFYLHCITRLCNVSMCASIRKKITNTGHTITAGPLIYRQLLPSF
uniref:ZP domain-containing protein n=1 Tax=Periophthalmus magnuspinnatus TaxID=409849 RepID=A0A3B4AAJ6_9GOBI